MHTLTRTRPVPRQIWSVRGSRNKYKRVVAIAHRYQQQAPGVGPGAKVAVRVAGGGASREASRRRRHRLRRRLQRQQRALQASGVDTAGVMAGTVVQLDGGGVITNASSTPRDRGSGDGGGGASASGAVGSDAEAGSAFTSDADDDGVGSDGPVGPVVDGGEVRADNGSSDGGEEGRDRDRGDGRRRGRSAAGVDDSDSSTSDAEGAGRAHGRRGRVGQVEWQLPFGVEEEEAVRADAAGMEVGEWSDVSTATCLAFCPTSRVLFTGDEG